MNAQLLAGKKVRLEKDITDKDKYGRLLRYVYVGDIFVNAEMVRQGCAWAMVYPPDIKYHGLFRGDGKRSQAIKARLLEIDIVFSISWSWRPAKNQRADFRDKFSGL